MGEPAELTPAETTSIVAFARKVVDSIRNDESMPQPRYDDGDAMSDDVLIAKMAMVILAYEAASEALVAAARKDVEAACEAAFDRGYDLGRRGDG